MKTSSFTTKSVTALLALAAITTLSETAQAQSPTYSSWHLTKTSAYVSPDGASKSAWNNGIIQQLGAASTTSAGGSITVQVKDPTEKVARKYTLAWTFDKDLSNVTLGQPLPMTLSIKGDAGATASSYNPGMLPRGMTNSEGTGELGENLQWFSFKNNPNPSNKRVVGQPYFNYNGAYSFRITLSGFTHAAVNDFFIDYSYSGVATPPPVVSPLANTPNWFYVSVGGAYYTFTKSGNTIVAAPYPSGAGTIYNFVSSATLGGVTPGVIVKQAGGALAFFIPNMGAKGTYANELYYNPNGGASWYFDAYMQGVQ